MDDYTKILPKKMCIRDRSRSDISAGTGMRHEDLQSVRTGSGKILLQHIHNIGTALYPKLAVLNQR